MGGSRLSIGKAVYSKEQDKKKKKEKKKKAVSENKD